MLQFYVNLMAIITERRQRDETGASAVEYGLLVVGVAIAVLAAVGALTGVLNGLFTRIGSTVNPSSGT